MTVQGAMLIGGRAVAGTGALLRGFDPARQQALEPDFHAADLDAVAEACALAAAACDALRAAGPEGRARLLEAIAANLDADREAICARAEAESGLPPVRIAGELGRTANQLLLFARLLRDGACLDARIDPALPDRVPPRPDLRSLMLPLGPVAVFGASNFPLAFSVAGGDTASALAAGCPVVVKAHPAHPGTSELAGRAIQAAVAACGLPAGIFALLHDAGHEVGAALVCDPRVQAVGFTGSRAGGLALMRLAQARPQPIPVYAEMSAINPVLLLPGALAARGQTIGAAFAAAVTLGAGQFCTNPGLLIAIDGPGLAEFVAGAAGAFDAGTAATMLTPGIHSAYCAGVDQLLAHPAVTLLAQGGPADGLTSRPALFGVDAEAFVADSLLHQEVFGAASLLVRCADEAALCAVIAALEGQLTVSVHADGDDDLALAGRLIPRLERLAGRVLFGGFGTGVEVCDAMVHGGPFPATSDGRSTSVGSMAIARFQRPVCYQDVPDVLLPPELRGDNLLGLPRRIDGVLAR